jgi:hypothetical protein
VVMVMYSIHHTFQGTFWQQLLLTLSHPFHGFLNLVLTYIGAHAQDLPQRGSADAQQQQIFVSYLERMVELKGNRVCYPLQTTKAWLGWLARQTRQRNQTVFYLEHLQPDWLSVKQQRSYTQMAVRQPLRNAAFRRLSYNVARFSSMECARRVSRMAVV